jgi:hypothetical protein
VAAGPLRGGKVCRQLTDDEGRQPDGSPAGTRLVRAGDQLAFDLGEDVGHGDRPGRQIDPAWAEPGQLADPQAAVGAHEYQRPVAGMDGFSKVDDLGGGEKAHLLPLDLEQRHVAAGGFASGSRAVTIQLPLPRRCIEEWLPIARQRPHSAEHAIRFRAR